MGERQKEIQPQWLLRHLLAVLKQNSYCLTFFCKSRIIIFVNRDHRSFSYKAAKLKRKKTTNNFFIIAEVLVGCPRHVAGPHLRHKQLKNRYLSSCKIICRIAPVLLSSGKRLFYSFLL